MASDTNIPSGGDPAEMIPGFSDLWEGARSLDADRIWQRIEIGLDEVERAPMAKTPILRFTTITRTARRTATMAAGSAIAAGIALGLVLGTSGSANAGFLAEVGQFSQETDAALADGVLSEGEAASLGESVAALMVRIEAGDELSELSAEELDQVIGTLVAARAELNTGAVGQAADADAALDGLAAVSAAVRAERASQTNGEAVVALPALGGTEVAQRVSWDDLPLTVIAGEAGSIQLSRVDGQLQVTRSATSEGWKLAVETPSGREIEVVFSQGPAQVRISAQSGDEDVRIALSSEDESDDGANGGGDEPSLDSIVVGVAGVVVLEYTDDAVRLVELDLAEGWELVGESTDGTTLSLDLASASGQARLTASVTDGVLAVEIVVDEDDADAAASVLEDGAIRRFPIDGELWEKTFVLEGGSVTIQVTETSIESLDVEAADGWEVSTERIEGREARVEFELDDVRSRFKAELTGGGLQVKIETLDRSDDDAADDLDGAEDAAGDLEEDGDEEDEELGVQRFPIEGELWETFALEGGTVTIHVTETGIEELEVDAVEGWDVTTERIAGREARVEFEQDETRVRFKAEVAGGRLQVKIETLDRDAADAADAADEDDADDAGQVRVFPVPGVAVVQIKFDDDAINEVRVVTRRGWEAEVAQGIDRVTVIFTEDGEGTEIVFEAELRDGELTAVTDDQAGRGGLADESDDLDNDAPDSERGRGRFDDDGDRGNGRGPSDPDDD
ncbi:MAG: hypothetical protein O6913_08175, partial [Chloroflexi bacterium]|nr:hypothetical protein [Chloroflexota bacterium]